MTEYRITHLYGKIIGELHTDKEEALVACCDDSTVWENIPFFVLKEDEPLPIAVFINGVGYYPRTEESEK